MKSDNNVTQARGKNGNCHIAEITTQPWHAKQEARSTGLPTMRPVAVALLAATVAVKIGLQYYLRFLNPPRIVHAKVLKLIAHHARSDAELTGYSGNVALAGFHGINQHVFF